MEIVLDADFINVSENGLWLGVEGNCALLKSADSLTQCSSTPAQDCHD